MGCAPRNIAWLASGAAAPHNHKIGNGIAGIPALPEAFVHRRKNQR